MQCVTQIMNSFLALKILTPMSVAVKHNRLNSVTSEDFKPSLALLVPATCITEHRALQKLGLCSLSYPSSHMNIETNHMGWLGVRKCWFEPCLSQMLGAQEMPQLIWISYLSSTPSCQASSGRCHPAASSPVPLVVPAWVVGVHVPPAVLSLLLPGGACTASDADLGEINNACVEGYLHQIPSLALQVWVSCP